VNSKERSLFQLALGQSKMARQSAANLGITSLDVKKSANVSKNFYLNETILEALHAVSLHLAESYQQVVMDFQDINRLTWAGTAHEIRELLRKLLDELAPNDGVGKQAWYSQHKDVSGPTQKQRVRFILERNKSDSKQKQVAANIDLIDSIIAGLVRDVYGRASDAAHSSKDKTEAYRILRYFEAFAYDLLNLKTT